MAKKKQETAVEATIPKPYNALADLKEQLMFSKQRVANLKKLIARLEADHSSVEILSMYRQY